MSEKINTKSDSVGTRERERPLGTAKLRLKDDIKIDIEDTGRETMDWNSSSSRHRLVVSLQEHRQVPSVLIKFWEFLDQLFK
jgi:hypothetical protein